jgi:uncharacterized protein (DUF433 family)
MNVETSYEHVALDERGIPMIAGTRMKIAELALDHRAYGWSPEEMKFQHPHLTLGQIYSALAYYWDHQEEVDNYIEQRLVWVDDFANKIKLTPLDIRLREKGLL